MSGRTTFDLLWIEGRTERWTRFGRIVKRTQHSRSESTVGFDPGAIFAFVRWALNDHGTIESKTDILRAVRYKDRNLVERFFNKTKYFRRIATRYEKLGLSYLAMLKLAAIRIWPRFHESTA